jgi:hypothetical protein
VGASAAVMGIEHLNNSWLVRRPADEAWPAAVVPADRTEQRYYLAAAATLIATLALMAAPVLIASLAIAGILR